MLRLADGLWDGQPVYVVGGGPSLKNFKWDRLEKQHVIATNCAYQTCPWPETILFARDRRWMVEFSKRSDYRQHKGTKVYHRVEPGSFTGVHYHLGESTEWGWHLWEGLVWCRNTGLAGLHLADVLGGNPIYLLGFDMKGENGQTVNWHRQYRSSWTAPDAVYREYVDEFVKYRQAWRGRVYNLCVNGGLAPHLRTKDVDEVLP